MLHLLNAYTNYKLFGADRMREISFISILIFFFFQKKKYFEMEQQ